MADEAVYDNIARNILSGKFYSTLPYCQTYPPGYPITLAIAYLLSSDKLIIYHSMLGINALISTLIIFPSYFILKRYCSIKTALLGAMVVATLPSSIEYSFVIMSENLFTTLFLFSILFLLESYGSNNKTWDLLAGFSIAYLFIVRSIGLAAIAGMIASFIYYAYTASRSRKITGILTEKRVLLCTIFITLLIWLLYSNFIIPKAGIGITLYNEGEYQDSLLSLFKFNNIQYSFSLLLHEIQFLILSSYFVFFFAFLYLLWRSSSARAQRAGILSAVLIYFLVSSSIIIIITISHMFLSFGEPTYQIIGRYLDPIVPALVVFGLIGLSLAYQKVKMNKSLAISMASGYVALAALFIATFPVDNYKFLMMMSVYYIQMINTVFPAQLLIALFPGVILLLFFLSSRYNSFRSVFLLFLICSSIIFTYYAVSSELNNSIIKDRGLDIQKYLQKRSDNDMIILMDSDFSDADNITFFDDQFWIPGKVIIDKSYDLSKGNFSNNIDYIISSKFLPYFPVVYSDETGYILYSSKSDNLSVSIPYMIDLGLNDPGIIKNFHEVERQKYRWTKGSSQVLIRFPAASDMNITLYTSGYRPENDPANVTLYVNDKKIGGFVKTSGDLNYSAMVPEGDLSPYYQILEIRTNTWRPVDHGLNNDYRDLGIEIEKIVVD